MKNKESVIMVFATGEYRNWRVIMDISELTRLLYALTDEQREAIIRYLLILRDSEYTESPPASCDQEEKPITQQSS